MSPRTKKFLYGFIPFSVFGVALSIAFGRVVTVYCGTITPVSPLPGLARCITGVWLPSLIPLALVPVGIIVGLILSKVKLGALAQTIR